MASMDRDDAPPLANWLSLLRLSRSDDCHTKRQRAHRCWGTAAISCPKIPTSQVHRLRTQGGRCDNQRGARPCPCPGDDYQGRDTTKKTSLIWCVRRAPTV